MQAKKKGCSKLPLTYGRSCLLLSKPLLVMPRLYYPTALVTLKKKTDKGAFLSVSLFCPFTLPRFFLISLSLPHFTNNHTKQFVPRTLLNYSSVRSTSSSTKCAVAAKNQSLRRTKSKRTTNRVNRGTKKKTRECRCKNVWRYVCALCSMRHAAAS